MTREHWPQVEAIYAAGIESGQATFESGPPTWESFDTGRLPDPRLVAVDGTEVLGWAAVTAVSDRCVYTGVVEHSVYVAPAAQGHGVGRLLLGALVDRCEDAGIWTLQAGIFPENTASLRLHLDLGFRIVGTRERVGRMTTGPLAGQWRDVTLVERRSDRVGV
ncbi:N-acetyltransferase [Nocardioides sp. MJB4]|uniref:N-acetyltransferase n=2 Tax=Nocardioides donggukensis TaxID=2774019 RepID=A0A927K6C9_9ACTN|nr:N-acetyltransferase [Nocardioides donggukensis]